MCRDSFSRVSGEKEWEIIKTRYTGVLKRRARLIKRREASQREKT